MRLGETGLEKEEGDKEIEKVWRREKMGRKEKRKMDSGRILWEENEKEISGDYGDEESKK
jgi:hypothetical protein